MADKQETPQILDQIAKGTGSKSSGRSTRSQQNARRRFYILLLLFIPVIGGLAYVGWFQLNVQQQMAALENQNSQLGNTVASYENEIATLSAQLDQLPEQIEPDEAAAEALDTLLTLNQRLETEVSSLRIELEALRSNQQEVLSPQPARWKILEADYLVNLAIQKLQLEADRASALLLLEQADSALQESGSGNVFTARQAISGDISALRAIEDIDREGLAIRLQNLTSRIAEISLMDSLRDNFENRRISDTGNESVVDPGMLERATSFLGTIFVWRRWEETPEAMLIPGQDSLIKQRINLNLEMAQTALVRNDEDLYQQGLADARDALQRFVDLDTPAGQALITELGALQQINISPQLPTLAASRNSVGQLAASLR
ncbi:MAG: uroporphyrinogen-III C-methyltransferase [Gammaproteobacteria bacterium]